MDLFRKKKPEQNTSSKHSKLGEGWEENSEAVTEGVSFYLKYLGSTLLEELPLGESYGEGVSSKAVQRIVNMAKTVGKKMEKVLLSITPSGIKVINLENSQVVVDVTIYRISFCTADKNHDKVFAFIARNTINETMECHAFFCAKPKIAQAVTLSVSQAFSLARDKWEKTNNKKNNHQHKTSPETTNNSVPEIPPRTNVPTPAVDLLSESHPRLGGDGQPAKSDSPRQGWQTFDDNIDSKSMDSDDSLEDCFSQLAENRSRTTDFPEFSTNVRQEDCDQSVRDYMNGGQKSLDAFSKSTSFEDLFNL